MPLTHTLSPKQQLLFMRIMEQVSAAQEQLERAQAIRDSFYNTIATLIEDDVVAGSRVAVREGVVTFTAPGDAVPPRVEFPPLAVVPNG